MGGVSSGPIFRWFFFWKKYELSIFGGGTLLSYDSSHTCLGEQLSDDPYHTEFVSWHIKHYLFFFSLRGWVGGPILSGKFHYFAFNPSLCDKAYYWTTSKLLEDYFKTTLRLYQDNYKTCSKPLNVFKMTLIPLHNLF